MGLKETEWESITWIALAKNRDKWPVFSEHDLELRIPQNVQTSLID